MVKTEEILRFEEQPGKSEKLEKSGKIRKPDEILEKKIIISNLRNKPLIMQRKN